jgi:hypothetical protein
MKQPAIDPRQRAHMLYQKIQAMGTRQVRLYRGMLLTYPFPARRGYGTRGLFVGVYNATVCLEWIEEDLVRVFTGEQS